MQSINITLYILSFRGNLIKNERLASYPGLKEGISKLFLKKHLFIFYFELPFS